LQTGADEKSQSLRLEISHRRKQKRKKELKNRTTSPKRKSRRGKFIGTKNQLATTRGWFGLYLRKGDNQGEQNRLRNRAIVSAMS